MDSSVIFPQIKPASFLDEEGNADLVSKTLFPGIVTCFVEDFGESLRYITFDRMDELKLDEGSLTQLANKNLAALPATESDIHIINHEDGTKAISYETSDSYDAARILLLFKEKLDYFIAELGDPFLVAIPCRDFLLAVPASYESKLAMYAKKLFGERPFPITSEIFLISKKKETFYNR